MRFRVVKPLPDSPIKAMSAMEKHTGNKLFVKKPLLAEDQGCERCKDHPTRNPDVFRTHSIKDCRRKPGADNPYVNRKRPLATEDVVMNVGKRT